MSVNRVLLGIGSNVERYRHLVAAMDALVNSFGSVAAISPVYESAAVGFCGAPFLNLVTGVDTVLSVGRLAECLRGIEADNGRVRESERFSDRTLDIDILTYGAAVGCIDGIRLPRGEILESAYVLKPLSDLVPDAVHPVTGRNYADLWREFRGDRRLRRVAFHWTESSAG